MSSHAEDAACCAGSKSCAAAEATTVSLPPFSPQLDECASSSPSENTLPTACLSPASEASGLPEHRFLTADLDDCMQPVDLLSPPSIELQETAAASPWIA